MNILTEIISAKIARVACAKAARPLNQVRDEAAAARRTAAPHALGKALEQNSRLKIIAEFKRRSPSKGLIRGDVEAAQIARAYERGGATAISVLTEEDYFAGSLDDLRAVRSTVALPILRKDFIVEEYQVYEAAAAGADALLLIVAGLNDEVLRNLRRIAEEELGMDALVEVHSSDELEHAIATGAKLIGVNNRDLRSFEITLETSVELAHKAPRDVVLVSESGLNTRADLLKLQVEGYRGFLIGEALMRARRPDEAIRALIED